MKSMQLTSAILVIFVFLAPLSWADGGTRDREKIIDVNTISRAMEKATQPVSNRMKSSRLKECYGRINGILGSEKVDKEALLDSLMDLEGEMDLFLKDWEEMVGPLWGGQDVIAGTINRVVDIIGRGMGGGACEEAEKLINNYDRRLKSLASQIKNESDPLLKERRKKVFANFLALRKLAESSGGIDLGPATTGVHVKIIRALESLQGQITDATFGVEQVRVVLISQKGFVSDYIDVLSGLLNAEELKKWLEATSENGEGFGPIGINVESMVEDARNFGEQMNKLFGQIAGELESGTDAFSFDAASSLLEGTDVDAEIKKYSKSSIGEGK